MAEVCDREEVTLIRRPVNGGPAAARNEALPIIATDLVAFVDSDCQVPPGWLDTLVGMFADPVLGAVAPRVHPSPSARPRPSVLDRYTEGRSALDMGPEAGEVGLGRVVGYVPTAALVVRVEALGSGFDERLRVGEDVDVVWRLLEEGWRVRYEPSVVVLHEEPASWARLLGRRYRYGTSAGPLAVRHPGRVVPVELRPWPTAIAAAVIARRPVAALVLLAGSTAAMARRVRRHGIPTVVALRWSARGAAWTGVEVGRAVTVLAGPVVVAGVLQRRRWATTAALLMTVPPLVDWWIRRPPLDPLRWLAASIVDDVAYGAGVWVGCARSRSLGPILPTVRVRSDRRPPRD